MGGGGSTLIYRQISMVALRLALGLKRAIGRFQDVLGEEILDAQE